MSKEMEAVARAMVAKGKGILAADESFPTIAKRFEMIQAPSTEENRRNYREMLFSAPDVNKFISGVILFDETLRQKTRDGEPIPELLKRKGIIAGIKVDKGAKSLAGFPGEKNTLGLDGLRERLEEYKALGAHFAKWRAVITIGKDLPTHACIEANAHGLTCYAALCQEAGIVPIVEPEVLMDADNTLERCREVTELTLKAVFSKLVDYRVALEKMVLKPNMVISGKKCPVQASPQEVADATVQMLRRRVPAAVPGIVFLSGGQSERMATEHLNLMNRHENLPWELSFSYGRALQESALKTWQGDMAKFEAGQKAFLHRAKCNSLARSGEYNKDMETA